MHERREGTRELGVDRAKVTKHGCFDRDRFHIANGGDVRCAPLCQGGEFPDNARRNDLGNVPGSPLRVDLRDVGFAAEKNVNQRVLLTLRNEFLSAGKCYASEKRWV